MGERAGDEAFFAQIQTHRARSFFRLMRRVPSDPRCAVCHAPFGGFGGRVMARVGFGPSRKNPRLCASCFERAPVGGVELDVGVLFADVRGFTSLSEACAPGEVAELLNRFYAAAAERLCAHAIIDKLVGDQVMALYLPQLLGEDAPRHMLEDARGLLGETGTWIELGVGLDYGLAHVGNVGAGEVKDFTAIGDVVNTAARLQGAAGAGEIVLSTRVAALLGGAPAGAAERELTLKGKAAPERAWVLAATPGAAGRTSAFM